MKNKINAASSSNLPTAKKKSAAGRPRQNPGALVRDCQITFGLPKEDKDALVTLSSIHGYATVSAYLRALVQQDIQKAENTKLRAPAAPRADRESR